MNWTEEHKDDPEVLLWLDQNPPPEDWEGSPIEYAQTQMASSDKTTGLVVGLGLLGLVVGAAWYINRPRKQQAYAPSTMYSETRPRTRTDDLRNAAGAFGRDVMQTPVGGRGNVYLAGMHGPKC